MYERLLNQRLFIYEKSSHLQNGLMTWKIAKRLFNFPSDLLDTTQHQLLFSPDFNNYLDMDRRDKSFVIKDTFT